MEKFVNQLGEPDVQLKGLQIWIHGRQYPNEQDYWDGNWLNVTAHCGSHGANVWTSGPILHVPDLVRWLVALEEMKQSMSGGANLVSMEPELSVELKMKQLGQVGMRVEITPDHMSEEHSFEFELDQTYLPNLIDEVRKVTAQFPMRGKPDSYGETEQALGADSP
jgi:hypothetical protein